MPDESKRAYEIIRHNFRTYMGNTTVDIVRGAGNAERAVQFHDKKLTQQQLDDGWSHFLKETTKKPWPKRRRVNLKPSAAKR